MVTLLRERIQKHLEEEGLDRKEFVRAMGYENLDKGLRRLDNWRQPGSWPSKEEPWPVNADQRDRLARVLPASPAEIKRLVEWEKEKWKLEALEERREDDRSYLVIQTSKWSKKSRTFEGDQSLDDIKETCSRVAGDVAEEMSDNMTKFFVATLNTPECRNYNFDEDGEILSVFDNQLSPGGPWMALK